MIDPQALRLLAGGVQNAYARLSDRLTPDQRATLADAVKLLRDPPADRYDYTDERACSACLHGVAQHHADNCIVGCLRRGCGCSRTQATAR